MRVARFRRVWRQRFTTYPSTAVVVLCGGAGLMKIHYNNGKQEKIIDNVIAVQVIGANEPVTALMANGSELTISLNNI